MPKTVTPSPWTLRGITRTQRAGASRVAAEVNGVPVWFDSEDADLEPYAETFAAPFLVAALCAGARLEVDAPLDPGWLRTTRQLGATFRRWWRLKGEYAVAPAETVERAPGRATGVAQCFTGGVDSFYTLLREDHGVDTLLFVHGYDIPLFDRSRAARVHALHAEVAGALGLRSVRLRTNLREHPDFGWVNWAITHGSALVAAAYAASATIGRLVIPSSDSLDREKTWPWGTHWETDALWSLPERLSVVHGDAPTRFDKIAAIVDEPLVHAHLRVCLQNVDDAYNCSACEKCLRTMALISAAGDLRRFSTFDHGRSLPERLDALAFVKPHLIGDWALTSHPDPAVRAAIERLLERSRRRARERRARRA